MFKSIVLTLTLLMAGCSVKSPVNTSVDLAKFGVEKSYVVNEERDVKILKSILEKAYKYQIYTSDSVKYKREDVHESIVPYIDFLEKVGQNITLDEVEKAGYDTRHFILTTNGMFVAYDCESTYLAIETLAIREGINPQRIYEVYCEVLADDLLTPAGGHMFGFYIGASGKNYTLEQLPHFRDLKMLYTENHYRFKELRRADKPINDFKKIPAEMVEDIINDKPLKVHPTNEVK